MYWNKHLIILAIFLVALSSPSRAGWVNDWIQQKSVGGAGAYGNLQSQSLISFGAMHLRWDRGTGPTPILSFTRPRLRAGCGGIDAKFGGFWFAGIDALVQKVQAIIQNVPAIMFQIALESISQALGEASKWVEGVIAKYSKFAEDECAAARSIVYNKIPVLAEVSSNAGQRIASLMRTIMSSEAASQDMGIYDDSTRATKDAVDTDTLPVSEKDIAATSCPSELQALLPASGNVSVLGRALQSTSLTAWEDVFRGMIGDVFIGPNTNKSGDTYEIRRIASCYENRDYSFDNLLIGNTKSRPSTGGDCVDDDPTGQGMLSYVETMLRSIADVYANPASTLSTEQENFIKETSIPVSYRMREAVMTKTVDAVVADMSLIVATAYAYFSMEDLYRVVRKTVSEYNELLTRDKKRLENCKILAAQNLPAELYNWSKDIYRRIMAMRTYYAAKIDEYNTMIVYSKAVLEQRQRVDRMVKHRSTQSVMQTKGN